VAALLTFAVCILPLLGCCSDVVYYIVIITPVYPLLGGRRQYGALPVAVVVFAVVTAFPLASQFDYWLTLLAFFFPACCRDHCGVVVIPGRAALAAWRSETSRHRRNGGGGEKRHGMAAATGSIK